MGTLRLSEMRKQAKNSNGKKLLVWMYGFKFFAGKRVHVIHDLPHMLTIRLYTESNVYQIQATDKYLGCTVSKRKPRPGEDWTRGDDLPDGEFLWDTFVSILGAIVCYELKEVAKPKKATPDVVECA